MWSSPDLQGGYPTQWILNPSAYQNVSNEEVDWASLAQQWIKMKETFPAEQVPPAPPPPPISSSAMSMPHMGAAGSSGMTVKGRISAGSDNLPSDLEGGEAPMDMDTKEENDVISVGTNSTTTTTSDSTTWGTWNNWQQWGWGGNWPASGTGNSSHAPGAVPPVPSGKAVGTAQSSFPYTPAPGTGHGYANSESSGTFDYNSSRPVEQFNQQGFWIGGPAPYIKQKSGDWRHDSRHLIGPPGHVLDDKSDEDEDTTPVIDAAKRKQLPAWIREGLEKMEKEKLKKQERERMQKERELEIARQKELELQQEQNNQNDVSIVPHSKFDTESEESELDGEGMTREVEPQAALVSRKSRFDQNSQPVSPLLSPARALVHPRGYTPSIPVVEPPQPVYKTKEEIMQETMKKVRIVLTDILMSVTSEELEKAANETLTNLRAKAPAKQHRKTPALTSLTGRLGLGIYNSDDDDSEASGDASDNETGYKRDNGMDSDEELKVRCQRRKLEFARMENDILSKIEEQEEKERRQMLEGDEDVNERGKDNDADEDEEDDDNNDDGDDDNDSKINEKVRNDGDKDLHQYHHYGVEHQVEAKHTNSGKKVTVAADNISPPTGRYTEESLKADNPDERRSRNNRSSDHSEESDDDDHSSESSDSSSRSDSSNSSHKRHKHSSSSSKKRKSKKDRNSTERSSNKSRRKRSRSRTRSRSRGSDRKTVSHRKSSHDSYSRRDDRYRKDYNDHKHRHRESYERSRTRDRDSSRSRDRDRDKRHGGTSDRYHRHTPSPHRKKHYSSSSASHKRRRSSSSPESVRSSKRSAGYEREYDYRRN